MIKTKTKYSNLKMFSLSTEDTELDYPIYIVDMEEIYIIPLFPNALQTLYINLNGKIDGFVDDCIKKDVERVKSWIINNKYIITALVKDSISITDFLNLMFKGGSRRYVRQRNIQKKFLGIISNE